MDSVSGVVDIPRETVVLMDGCNHFDICRFGNETSGLYKRVSFHIEKLANGKFKPFPLSFDSVYLFICLEDLFLFCKLVADFSEHLFFLSIPLLPHRG